MTSTPIAGPASAFTMKWAYHVGQGVGSGMSKFADGDFLGGALDILQAAVSVRNMLRSCFAAGTPIEAEMNEGMIKGLRFGIAGMHAGGQRRLVDPPTLAYGRSQYGRVPPNSTLVFDVQLVSVR